MRTYRIAMAVLFVFILISALSLVYVKHRSRTLFVELHRMTRVSHNLEEQYSRLLLEQSALLSHGKVEAIARDRLKMKKPEVRHVVVIR